MEKRNFSILVSKHYDRTYVTKGYTYDLVEGECNGNTLILKVNNFLVLETQDSDFAWGGVGLIVSTNAGKAVKVKYNDIAVLKPSVIKPVIEMTPPPTKSYFQPYDPPDNLNKERVP